MYSCSGAFRQTSDWNFNVQLFWKPKNRLMLCFMSQLQYSSKTQKFISNFVYQVIKKRNGTLGTQIVMVSYSFLATNSFWWNNKIKTTIDY